MKEFTIVRGLFDNRKRSLIIAENFIKFENKDQKEDLFTIIKKEDIAGIRYGIHFIKGFEFYIGREYLIFIRDQSNKEIKINFKLFYGRRLKEKHQLYNNILDEIWDNFIHDISRSYLRKFQSKENFELSGIQIFDGKIKFNNNEILIEDLGIKTYHHHFIIYSKTNNYNNRMLYYLKDKDAVILLDVLNNIITKEVNKEE